MWTAFNSQLGQGKPAKTMILFESGLLGLSWQGDIGWYWMTSWVLRYDFTWQKIKRSTLVHQVEHSHAFQALHSLHFGIFLNSMHAIHLYTFSYFVIFLCILFLCFLHLHLPVRVFGRVDPDGPNPLKAAIRRAWAQRFEVKRMQRMSSQPDKDWYDLIFRYFSLTHCYIA